MTSLPNANKMYAEPDKLIDFGTQPRDVPQRQTESKFNFEGFWKQKIGLGGAPAEDPRAPAYAGSLNEAASGSYQDDSGRNIYER